MQTCELFTCERMRLVEFLRARAQEVRKTYLVPFAPGNPFQQKEPYDFFRLVGPYPPGWRRQSNFGTVERLPPRYPEATVPATTSDLKPLVARPQVGEVPSIRPLSEEGEPYTFFQRMPASENEPYDTSQRMPASENELYDLSFRGQIGAPRHIYKHIFKMPQSQKEVYDFTF